MAQLYESQYAAIIQAQLIDSAQDFRILYHVLYPIIDIKSHEQHITSIECFNNISGGQARQSSFTHDISLNCSIVSK